MTWRELRDVINEMPETELDEEVIFADSNDDGECHPVDVTRADEDISTAWGCYAETIDDEDSIMVHKGSMYLY